MSKELDYIVKRKNKIGKKLDKDQSLLEEGKLYSSDKQWFSWCEEYETLQSIEKELKRLEKMDNALLDGQILVLKKNEEGKYDLYSCKVNDSFKDCATIKISRYWNNE